MNEFLIRILVIKLTFVVQVTCMVNATSTNTHIFPVLPVETRQKHKDQVQQEIEKRWDKVLQIKSSFSPYAKKSDQEIKKEFQALQCFRMNLWYKNPDESPRICQEDYMISQDLLEKGHYRVITNIAFVYNRTDSSYNASTILLEGYHFIALQEPNNDILNLFFKFLVNHQISVLVRVKPEQEFKKANSVKYWSGRLKKTDGYTSINVAPEKVADIFIPYCYTDEWQDDKGVDVKELYRLVQEVRNIYATSGKNTPIACHCASGVGRTGTFIAAFVLAELIDKSNGTAIPSIEEMVMKLSIQRPNLMGTSEQYLVLYKFADYYLSVRK